MGDDDLIRRGDALKAIPTGWSGQPHQSNINYGPNVSAQAKAAIAALPAAPAEAHRITMKQDQSGVFIAHDVCGDIMTQGPTKLEAWERLAATIAVETYNAPWDAAPAEDVRAGALAVADALDAWADAQRQGRQIDASITGLRDMAKVVRALIPEAKP